MEPIGGMSNKNSVCQVDYGGLMGRFIPYTLSPDLRMSLCSYRTAEKMLGNSFFIYFGFMMNKVY